MKRLLALIVCITIVCGVKAQDQHLSFKGVPIDGTLKEFTKAMKKAGCKSIGTAEDGTVFLSGDFAGCKDCIILVSTMNNFDVVNRVVVMLPQKEVWASLVYDYEGFKSLLTKKYGTPVFNYEEFAIYTGGDNGLEMQALYEGQVMWDTGFRTELGDIELCISRGTSSGKGYVRLVYYDRANSEKIKQSALDEL